MRTTAVRQSRIRIGIMENDPVRQVGFHSILDRTTDFRVTNLSASELYSNPGVDVVLMGSHSPGFFETMTQVKALSPELRVLVTGMSMDDESVLKAIVYGAKGCVDESAAEGSFVQAIRAVHRGSVWAPRRVMSLLIERTGDLLRQRQVHSSSLTAREKQVLSMLVEGRSNKEIGLLLGIKVRTVKAHVAKLLRKVGARNRISLSMQAIKHSLVPTQ